MNKIKVSELFYSIQGEGQYVGTPSIFLRTFGCNLSCSGFGMPEGQRSTERDIVATKVANFTDYKQLPLVSTGCDSYASWDPRFKHLSPVMTISAIVDRMQELLPSGKFSENKHLIITGGEPLLPGWQKQYTALFKEIELRNMNLTHVTFETNGTQYLSEDLAECLWNLPHIEFTFSISAKLPVSGENWSITIQPNVVREYLEFTATSYFKFVVASEQDIKDATRAVTQYKESGIDIPVYLMPVGGTNEVYSQYEKNVAKFCLQNGLRFSPRIQVPLFKNAWGT